MFVAGGKALLFYGLLLERRKERQLFMSIGWQALELYIVGTFVVTHQDLSTFFVHVFDVSG